MKQITSGLLKQGALGWVMLLSFAALLSAGAVSLSVGYVVLAWNIFLSRGLGAPSLDFWGGLGLLMFIVPVLVFVYLVGQEGK